MSTKANIQTEIDAAFLYQVLANAEEDAQVATIFKRMAELEMEHAHAFAKKAGIAADALPGPSLRARILKRLGQWWGNELVLGTLLDTEKRLAGGIAKTRKNTASTPSISDQAHVTILKNLLEHSGNVPASQVARFEKKHRSVGGNALRAAVLGGNDGLVSNFSLVMGVAGASSDQQAVLLAGTAGLLAGALSMALGEWISVKSSQELYENQMQLEMEELETNPETEQKEIVLIYMAKGIPEAEAAKMAADLMQDKTQAHAFLVKEELGIQTEELEGSAMEAAIFSFVLFAIGAIIPLLPFFFSGGYYAIAGSAVLSSLGLFGIGAAITLFTGRSMWYSGMRQVLFGLVAAAITYAIGTLIGVSIAG